MEIIKNMYELNIEIKKKIFPLKTQNKQGKNLIFKNLNFTIKKGQFVSFFGPSGCGKTTLLNIISGLDKDFDGQISRYDKASDISYMFQTPRLFPWLTAIEMQRRVAMARAFAPNPNILLLDEPFISIDKKITNSLRKLLIQLWRKNKPIIIFVTHDLDEAIELADRIVFLSNLPSKILLDYKVNLARPRNQNSKNFISLKRLLSSSTRTIKAKKP